MRRKLNTKAERAIRSIKKTFEKADETINAIETDEKPVTVRVLPWANSKILKKNKINLTPKLAVDDDGKAYVFNFDFSGKAEETKAEVLRLIRTGNAKWNVSVEDIRILGRFDTHSNGLVDVSNLPHYKNLSPSIRQVLNADQYFDMLERLQQSSLDDGGLNYDYTADLGQQPS